MQKNYGLPLELEENRSDFQSKIQLTSAFVFIKTHEKKHATHPAT